MSLPSFTAEDSLYTSSRAYVATTSFGITSAVLPQAFFATDILGGVRLIGGPFAPFCIAACVLAGLICAATCGGAALCIAACFAGAATCSGLCLLLWGL